MRILSILSCVVVLGAAGCGGKATCADLAKTWCARARECGGTVNANCEAIVTNLCTQTAPAACTEPADASECISAASNESCELVLAGRPPSCNLKCK